MLPNAFFFFSLSINMSSNLKLAGPVLFKLTILLFYSRDLLTEEELKIRVMNKLKDTLEEGERAAQSINNKYVVPWVRSIYSGDKVKVNFNSTSKTCSAAQNGSKYFAFVIKKEQQKYYLI